MRWKAPSPGVSGRDQFDARALDPSAPGLGVQIGDLVAFTDDGRTPLVCDPAHPGSAILQARTVVDLHAEHIGQQVLLAFESGDAARGPVILGVLRGSNHPISDQGPGQLHVDADGQRLVVDAKQQLVLRCGKASITLTKAGKVLIAGAYVLSRSTGVNRLKGGSVQIN